MDNIGQKAFKFIMNGFRWCFGVFLILGGLINIPTYGIAGVFLILSAMLILPPVTDWVVKKINHKTTSGVVASVAFLLSIIALGNTPVPQPATSESTSTPQGLTSKPTTSAAPPPITTNKTVVAPVVVTTNAKPKNNAASQPMANSTVSQTGVGCKVVGISDGDTLTCLSSDNMQIKVRLNQIDAPEKSQAFGTAAKQALSGYVFGKTVGLKTNGTDKYGRTIAEVFVGDKNINKAMVADGYAWAYREYMTDNDYGDLETSARSNTKGLWSEPDPIYPSDFRRGKRGEQTAPVQTQTITQQVEQKAVADSGSSCGSKRYCKQMATCAEARHYLNDCGVSRLDRDGDGVPCESLCN